MENRLDRHYCFSWSYYCSHGQFKRHDFLHSVLNPSFCVCLDQIILQTVNGTEDPIHYYPLSSRIVLVCDEAAEDVFMLFLMYSNPIFGLGFCTHAALCGWISLYLLVVDKTCMPVTILFRNLFLVSCTSLAWTWLSLQSPFQRIQNRLNQLFQLLLWVSSAFFFYCKSSCFGFHFILCISFLAYLPVSFCIFFLGSFTIPMSMVFMDGSLFPKLMYGKASFNLFKYLRTHTHISDTMHDCFLVREARLPYLKTRALLLFHDTHLSIRPMYMYVYMTI
jgi:hypothetical protein